MTVLSSYAESTYKETLVDPAEFATDQGSPVLAPVKEVPEVTERKESSSRPLLEVSRLMYQEPDPIELSRPEVIEDKKSSSRLRPEVTERKRSSYPRRPGVTEHKKSSSRPRPEVFRTLQRVSDLVILSRPPSKNPRPLFLVLGIYHSPGRESSRRWHAESPVIQVRARNLLHPT